MLFVFAFFTGMTTPQALSPEPLPELSFSADLSDYESYMNPGRGDEYLILVNRTHPVGQAPAPVDLTELSGTRHDGRPVQKMLECDAMALQAMFLELEALGYLDEVSKDGFTFSVTSGYRSYEYQASLFEIYKNQYMAGGMTEEEALQRVSKTTALPGKSEHQTGLCVDMHDRLCATADFDTSPVFAWLSENAWKFGFILRYPKGKETVTGYSYEPWHYRFVGRYHAEQMHRSGLCLEEYIKRRSG
ncbi:MAG: M15 family metallopeptidase [Clostridia bacterium]|nr:M15 family metallopeptidase [Clostridia bacterium]